MEWPRQWADVRRARSVCAPRWDSDFIHPFIGAIVMSWLTWFRSGSQRNTTKTRRRPRRLGCRPALDLLEDRLAPAAIGWDGGAGGVGTDWNTPANWVGDTLPGSNDDAQISAA